MAKRKTASIDSNSSASVPTTKIVRANVKREVRTSEDFVSLYANDAQIQMSPWDVRIILGTIENRNSADAVQVKEIGELRLSPQFAKRLTMILIQQLKGYEATLGMIPIPKDE